MLVYGGSAPGECFGDLWACCLDTSGSIEPGIQVFVLEAGEELLKREPPVPVIVARFQQRSDLLGAVRRQLAPPSPSLRLHASSVHLSAGDGAASAARS